MAAKSALDLLPAVRRHVLQQAAAGHTLLALSAVTWAVDREAVIGNPQAHGRRPHSILNFSWSPQKRRSKLGHRGWVQRCLSQLAKEGLLWERQRPEGNVMYEPVDKFFRIRIKQAEAAKRVK